VAASTTDDTEKTVARAAGTFEVTLTPQSTDIGDDGNSMARLTIEKEFRGDLEGTSKGEMLSAGTQTRGSAAYVGQERVTGTLGGRRGAFVLQHTGVMNRGKPSLTVTVVPDSGSGDLAGISGTMNIIVEPGKHSYEMEYEIDAM
jgi:uncharacterized protein DUF3224